MPWIIREACSRLMVTIQKREKKYYFGIWNIAQYLWAHKEAVDAFMKEVQE